MGKKNRRRKAKDGSQAQVQAKKQKTSNNGGHNSQQTASTEKRVKPSEAMGDKISSASPSSGKKQNKLKSLDGNPFKTKLEIFLAGLTALERESFFSDSLVTPERRAEIWMQQADVGEDLVNRYSWAVPDKRSMQIIKHFNPIVEMGCGANAYWCRQMQKAGIDVVGYDVSPKEGGRINQGKESGNLKVSAPDDDDDSHDDDAVFQVKKGGPEVLSQHSDRTLFLCYPDENDDNQITPPDDVSRDEPMSLGEACLHYFKGDHIIHIGEIYGDTLSMAQAPWGRSSSPQFQQQLSAEFHCILKIPLQGWLHVRDSLTVWKRSGICKIVFAAEGDDDEEEEEEVAYRYVPVEERLPSGMAAPCLAHLISEEQGQERPQHPSSRAREHDKGVSSSESPDLAAVAKKSEKAEVAKQPDKKSEKAEVAKQPDKGSEKAEVAKQPDKKSEKAEVAKQPDKKSEKAEVAKQPDKKSEKAEVGKKSEKQVVQLVDGISKTELPSNSKKENGPKEPAGAKEIREPSKNDKVSKNKKKRSSNEPSQTDPDQSSKQDKLAKINDEGAGSYQCPW